MTSQFPNLIGFQDLWDMFIQASTPYVKTCFLNTELLCFNTEMTWHLYLASLCSLSSFPEATFWTQLCLYFNKLIASYSQAEITDQKLPDLTQNCILVDSKLF